MPERKIEHLTPEQEARFPEFVERWTAIGLSTAPADRPRAEDAVAEMYRQAGGGPPARIMWCGSPLSGALTRAATRHRNAELGAKSVWESVWQSVRQSVYGQPDAAWLAFHAYVREVLGCRRETDPLMGLMELAQSAGWALPAADICWVSERPNLLVRDLAGRLHAEDGPALRYPDGWGIYAWHGVRVPASVIEAPGQITAAAITAEPNQEVRRAMIERIGWLRYLELSDAEVVQRDDAGTLLKLPPIPGESDPCYLVRVTNSTPEPDGTFKDYVLRVHPECRPILGPDQFGDPQALTAINAVASTFGLEGRTYLLTAQT